MPSGDPIEVKPGQKTTEFWITMIPYLLLIIKQVTGIEFESEVIVNGILGGVAAVSTIVYILGRVKVKTRAMELEAMKNIPEVKTTTEIKPSDNK